MPEHATIHLWGFYDGDTQRPTDRAAVCEGSVYDAYCTVAANVMHFGGGITNRRTTRDLDGWLRGVEFDVPAHGDSDLIWHRILEAADPWPDPTTTQPTAALPESRGHHEESADVDAG